MKDFAISDTVRISVDKGSFTIQTREAYFDRVSETEKMGKWKTRGYYSTLFGALSWVFEREIIDSDDEMFDALMGAFRTVAEVYGSLSQISELPSSPIFDSEKFYTFSVDRQSFYPAPGGGVGKTKPVAVTKARDLRRVMALFLCGVACNSPQPADSMDIIVDEMASLVSILKEKGAHLRTLQPVE